MKTKLTAKKFRNELLSRGVVLMGVSILTGMVVGVLVTIYNVLAKSSENFSVKVYDLLRENPAYIPLLFVALFIAAFMIAVVVKFVPMIKGSGIPQTEGAARGVMKYNWWKVLVGMAAASLFTIFMGVSAGAEGPSLMLGGASGCGVARSLRQREVGQRYQITAGASAGLAVAFNAPLTGLLFALEETHRRFTAEILISAFASVTAGVVTRNLILSAMGKSVGATFTTFLFPTNTSIALIGYVIMAAVVAGLLGVGFYKLCLLARRLFGRLKFWKGMGKFMIPFLVAGALGLISVNVMGGGHALIESLGTNGGTREMAILSVLGSPLMVTLAVVLIMKIFATILNLGCGVPCGIFIPMLAIGACLGALSGQLCVNMGMDKSYLDVITMISMAAFFTTVVKAPVTSIVMVFELTWSFTALVPVLIGVGIGYMISMLFRLEPLYEKLLELIGQEMGLHDGKKRMTVKAYVQSGEMADGKTIREILWPSEALVLAVIRATERIIPESDTKLMAGDLLVVMAGVKDVEELKQSIYSIVGQPAKSDPLIDEAPTPTATE